jgi:hypothetical protein
VPLTCTTLLVLEAAHHVGDRVGLADVGQELVAQALALRGARDQAGDVDELHRGRQDLLRLDDGRQLVEARVGHFGTMPTLGSMVQNG